MNIPFIEFSKGRKSQARKIYIHKGKTEIGNRICVNRNGSPFFSIPNENGTVKLFLEALENKYFDEAMGYISKNVSQFLSFEEIYSVFEGIKSYKCLISVSKESPFLKQVSIAVKRHSKQKIEIINLKMINEPDNFGKWKIYQIEKE
ncbi:MAG: hypothetical protein IAC55_08105 [Tyzzerella sp.]|uniref:Uncharacterized protein n=1 Tax=Candidatus Fimicola merdigallinarum TaxID=2840819 RepID=A0A9D9DWL9_9FIRM|nr:hypothetical protein [Candidatus Fimicola merdigallinarum]